MEAHSTAHSTGGGERKGLFQVTDKWEMMCRSVSDLQGKAGCASAVDAVVIS